jgi:hypothetical protein
MSLALADRPRRVEPHLFDGDLTLFWLYDALDMSLTISTAKQRNGGRKGIITASTVWAASA